MMTVQEHYIHHPDEFPIELNLRENDQANPDTRPALKLICHSQHPFTSGAAVAIHLPDACEAMEVHGIIDWCTDSQQGYELGIKFIDQDAMMRIRMLEQICYIKRYRNSVLTQEGRDLSDQDAALEWIAKYSRLFPAAR